MSFSEKKKDQVLTQDRDNSISHCPTRRLTRPRERLPISSSDVGAAGYLNVRINYQVDFAGRKWYFGTMNRKHTAIHRMTDHRNDDYVPGTPEDRISLVWPLTREIVSLRE